MRKIIRLNGNTILRTRSGKHGNGGNTRQMAWMGVLRRACLLGLYCVCAILFVYLVYGEKILWRETEQTRQPMAVTVLSDPDADNEIPIEKMSCHLPKLNPFDESIRKYKERDFEDLNCQKNFPLVFSMDLNSNLLVVKDPEEFGLKNCCYKSFLRASENRIRLSPVCYPIDKKKVNITPAIEFIAIQCLSTRANKTKIVDMFAITRIKSKVEDRIQKIEANMSESDLKNRLNFIVLGLDGVSHMNFIRTMPKTYEFLTNNLSAIGMNGYNKVGDNTFPNLVPTLTGMSESELKASCWENDEKYFDECPLIWKNFTASGYRTAFGEDAAWMGMFNYQKRGFLNPPTDYYLRTLTLAQAKRIGHDKRGNAELCYGPRVAFQVLLKNICEMANRMGEDSQRRYFQFIWATALFHDYLTAPTAGDGFLYSALAWLQENGHLDQTVLILMSDHGIRWGDIRTTFQGKVEERMPLLYFVFPAWFKAKYPTAVRNLRLNAEKLTTPFDLYHTLMDLKSLGINMNDGAIEFRSEELSNDLLRMPKGISLFLPIPASRTCHVAGVDDHWCVCHPMEPISTGEDDVEIAAAIVVRDLNALLKDYPPCAELKLMEIKSAQTLRIDHVESVFNVTVEKSVITVILSTVPGNAVFEATVTKTAGRARTVSGDISRLNLYGEQSHCVSDYKVKKYCFCG